MYCTSSLGDSKHHAINFEHEMTKSGSDGCFHSFSLRHFLDSWLGFELGMPFIRILIIVFYRDFFLEGF